MNEELIRQIMEEVIRQINSQEPALKPCCEGMDKLLVIGKAEDVPENLKCSYTLYGLDDYTNYRNILRYQKIIITKLSLTELSDIAQGRDASPAACAVVNGLLNGLEVYMMEKALRHRRFAGKGSTRLYEVIEGHVRTLQTYGIKILCEEKPVMIKEAKPPKYKAEPAAVPKGSGSPNPDRLITEAAAIKLIEGCEGRIQVPANAIITPSAWDVFSRNKIDVIRA